MLNLSSSEVRVIRAWSERGEASPFPQEMALIKRLKGNISNREMKLTAKELEVVLHWADLDTKGHHSGDRYLLELEASLIDKIESYLSEMDDQPYAP